MPTPRHEDGKPNFSRIGRGNKNRGRKYEREVAELLGWTRVPYSGAIADWGGGDVVDGFYTRNGIWSAECKTQQPGPRNSISIKDDWLRQIERVTGSRRPIIITKNVGTKVADSFVFMRESTWLWYKKALGFEFEEAHRCHVTARGKGHGFVVGAESLENATDGNPILVTVRPNRENMFAELWAVFRLSDFATAVRDNELMIPEIKPTDAELANTTT